MTDNVLNFLLHSPVGKTDKPPSSQAFSFTDEDGRLTGSLDLRTFLEEALAQADGSLKTVIAATPRLQAIERAVRTNSQPPLPMPDILNWTISHSSHT